MRLSAPLRRLSSPGVQRDAPLAAPRGRASDHALRVGRGLRKPANWVQLVKFSAVGASGYVVNLAVYTALVHALGVHYILAAVLAFCVAVTNNFLWNRHWTFEATDGHMGFQAARFLTVSVVALGFNLIVLELLVNGRRTSRRCSRRRSRSSRRRRSTSSATSCGASATSRAGRPPARPLAARSPRCVAALPSLRCAVARAGRGRGGPPVQPGGASRPRPDAAGVADAAAARPLPERACRRRASRRAHPKLREELREPRRRHAPRAFAKGPGRWQVSWYAGGDEIAQVIVDEREGRAVEVWTGPQVAWQMARGLDGRVRPQGQLAVRSGSR